MPEYYLGLMSGTSVDGIDAALVDLSRPFPALVRARTFAWPKRIRQQILDTTAGHQQVSLLELGRLDATLGDQFAEAALAIIGEAELNREQISAIGSHGQTLFHAADADPPFSMQLGDANRIAEHTGITTVADFRRRDIAAGGQGAPLVPAFHQALFQDPHRSRVVLNIGGMANVTLLPKDGSVSGFDTGPGNVLMDAWHQRNRQALFDRNGEWARSGKLDRRLLDRLLDHPYFRRTHPKSTGRETFGPRWLDAVLHSANGAPAAADVQRTLLELTARSIADSLQKPAAEFEQLLVCGGGAHNGFLMQRLGVLLPSCSVESTENCGLHPDWVEATAFAWLAKQTLQGKPGNLPEVTGANKAVVLGAIYPGASENNNR
jgi:anhydro-N-acetylmuramic acid kinase